MSQSIPVWARAVAALLVIAGIGAGSYYLLQTKKPPVVAPTIIPAKAPEAVTPAIQYPVASEVPGEDAAPVTLPVLQDSDPEALAALLALLADPGLDAFIKPEFLIPRIVATVDNLPRERLNSHALPVQRVPGVFAVRSVDNQVFIAEANAARYAPYVLAFESADVQQWAQTYRRWYPLFQRAYVELGDPNAYFNDRLIAVIDHLLMAPNVPESIALVKPKSMWEFADPDLQAASIGHRLLFRLGPDQAQRVKARLIELRAAIIALGKPG